MQGLPPPLLLTSDEGDEFVKQYFYNLLENQYHTTLNPILHKKAVICSAYGWLVLLNRTTLNQAQCCLWNPTSSQIIHLPSLDYPGRFNRCFLSKPPTEPDCFILFNHARSMEHILCRIQDNVLIEINFLLTEGRYQLLSMVSFQGMIYGIIQPRERKKYEFVTVHMAGDKLETKPLLIDGELPWEVPQAIRSWAIYSIDYLIESPCGNELLLVTKTSSNEYLDSTMHFRVFRVDVGRMECEELDNLDGRTIFISYDGNGFCRYSESFGVAIKPNSIYYTNIGGMVIYVYDLDDKGTTTLLPYPDADIDPDTVESYWVDLS